MLIHLLLHSSASKMLEYFGIITLILNTSNRFEIYAEKYEYTYRYKKTKNAFLFIFLQSEWKRKKNEFQ